MSIAVRSAEAVWNGSLANGHGTLSAVSGALDGQRVTWASRTERAGGMTSPEELCAAAHAACYSMALALKLGEAGHRPEMLWATAVVTLDEVEGTPTIVSSVLEVEARVPGIKEGTFHGIVDEAARLCPVARLFAGAEVVVSARLEAS